MTTLSGFVRSAAAASRRAERERQRHARDLAKSYKEHAKQKLLQDNAQAVTHYNNYLLVLQSVHKEASKTINWDTIKNEAPPERPQLQQQKETAAIHKLKSYKPSIFDKLL